MILFLYGEDTYRSSERLKEFISVAVERNGEVNVEIVPTIGKSFEQLKAFLETVPFISGKRLVVFKELLSDGDTEICTLMLAYLKKFKRDDLNIIFYESNAMDKRRGLFKWLNDNDEVKRYTFDILQGKDLEEFAKNGIVKLGGGITGTALGSLCFAVGGDLARMKNEIEKLCMYKDGEQITLEDVQLLVQRNVESDVFKMIDALGKRDFKTAREEFGRLLFNGNNEFYLFSMITYQFRNLVRIKYLFDKGFVADEIVKMTKLHPFVVKKIILVAQSFKMSELCSIYNNLLEMDLATKTISEYDLVLEIDKFSFQLCMGSFLNTTFGDRV